ncbi:MAG: hypothetical protein A4E40_00008 [Methanoregulaceae archaeon PtaU1.Bin059]|nr:MAG: hypothetical protein A4E40_00008 [Methanoregulaceae archaeon PtaU1.Bin059]
MRKMNKKILLQSTVALFIGISLYGIGDIAGLLPEFLIPLGILFGIGGVIGIVLSLIIHGDIKPE